MKLFSFLKHSGIELGHYKQFFFRRPLRVEPSDIRTHIHVWGKSGSGKSNFLAALFVALRRAGMGATLIDPHGDLAQLVMAHLIADGVFETPEGFNSVVYLDIPAAEEKRRYMPFNVLDQEGAADTIATNIKEACHRAWPELAQGAATFDTLLFDTVLLLVSNGYPLTAAFRLLTNDKFRKQLLDKEKDVDLVDSFRDVYEQFKRYDQVSYAGSLLRRVRQLTQLNVLKYGLGQQHMLLNFRQLMDTKKTVIINLKTHNQDAAQLLGCFLTVAYEEAAKSRKRENPGTQLPSHHLFIDECQLFIAQSEKGFSNILSQARKYGLHLLLSHQNWSQIPEYLRGALQNVSYEFAFKQGRDDAERSAKLVGEVNPMEKKHEVEDIDAAERSHPTFFPLAEQWERWVQRMQKLSTGQAWVKTPTDRVLRLQTQHMPFPPLVYGRYQQISDWYLNNCFRAQADLEQELTRHRSDAPPPGTRSGVVPFT